ncbi:hypothetical protein DMENIID0001_044500 [Sergentomyia squamirostris]
MNTTGTIDLIFYTIGEITRLAENVSKLGPSRRKAKGLSYYDEKLRDLDGHWAEIERCNTELIANVPDNHYYHAEGTFDKAKTAYEKAKALINQIKLSDFPPSIPQDLNQSQNLGLEPNDHHMSIDEHHPNDVNATNAHRELLAQQLAQLQVTWQTIEERERTQRRESRPGLDNLDVQGTYDNTLQTTHNFFNQLPKLPAIQIKRFSGEEKDWPLFIELFTSVFHDNPTLSNVQKMQYLLSYLEAQPKKLICHLALTHSNYASALSILKARYENKRQMVSTYVNSIVQFKRLTTGSSEDILKLHDCVNSCLAGLQNLGYLTSSWDPILVSIITQKFDAETNKAFEESVYDITEVPSIREILTFLLKRYRIVKCSPKDLSNKKDNKKQVLHSTAKKQCSHCKKDHLIYQCEEFKKLTPHERSKQAKKLELCINCLCHKNDTKCKSKKTCLNCQKPHHTLLHFEKNNQKDKKKTVLHTQNDDNQDSESEDTAVSLHTTSDSALLPTAIIKIKSRNGDWLNFRALLDTGSGDSYITEHAVQTLGLKKIKISTTITGIGGAQAGKCKALVEMLMSSRFTSTFKARTKAFVLPTLTARIPSTFSKKNLDLHYTKQITLADPDFNIPAAIDIILSANVYANILKTNVKKCKSGLLIQETELGWVVMGRPDIESTSSCKQSFISIAEIDQTLRKFWEMDVNTDTPAQQEQECEDHFQKTHKRLPDGRYQVALPFKPVANEQKLGNSRKQAVARLLSMEKKFSKEAELKTQYVDFMREYHALGHMSPVNNYDGPEHKVYYLPHHAVMKAESTTTKLRVVFDASCKTSTGTSLNDILHTGPKIQQNLTDHILRWRKYEFVMTADAEKMFRQALVREEDRDFTRIVWRENPRDPIQEFQLNTITYGTGPATYLAVRVLKQLAIDESDNFPMACKVLCNDFYVDDMITGAYTLEEAQQLQCEITQLLARGGFNLRKWTSNSIQILERIPEQSREKGIIHIQEDETIKPLGIHWSPLKDQFQFTIKIKAQGVLTKRNILSEIASIFDPTGWLAAVMLRAKLIMQAMWKERVEWDEKPSESLRKLWIDFKHDIKSVEEIRIDRWLKFVPGDKVQIHGFSDASEKAYAACIYIRIQHNSSVTVRLLTAKTRVAPLKGKITLPRLELCGASLLAELMHDTIQALDMVIESIHAWSDSQIVLAWIKRDPSTWDTYVSNRVAKIHSKFPRNIWNHVCSEDNPADIATRQITAKFIKDKRLWWRGPSWLRQEYNSWPLHDDAYIREVEDQMMTAQNCLFTLSMYKNDEELRVAAASIAQPESEDDKIKKFLGEFKSFHKLITTVAYWLRFKDNCLKTPKDKEKKTSRNPNLVTFHEYQKAKTHIIRLIQRLHYAQELLDLEKNKCVSERSKLRPLNPILQDGIIKVGGRIQNSHLRTHAKHPIILPKCHTTNTMIMAIHLSMLHGGIQLTLSQINAKYWICKGRSYIKSVIGKCMSCARQRKIPYTQLMGELPAERVTPAPPFSRCGVDYAGPIITKRNKGRGNVMEKSYIAIFVCLVTKAVHVEAVTDLTAEAFLAALRRFIARRGKPSLIMSDNGTNFVGAQKILDRETALAIKAASEFAAQALIEDEIKWKFIPPGSPHFGGIWEAAVKSVKTHLTRTIGLTKLTYEELATLLAQVEACLNSRPLAPLSNDLNDLDVLTPGHFLIGRPLSSPAQPDISEKSLTKRWKLITKFSQQIWIRWAREYLTTLHQRTKWTGPQTNPIVGQLVMMKEDNLPPLKWPLARILELHPGPDGLVRVVTVKTRAKKTKQAPIHKLIQLPQEDEDYIIHEKPPKRKNDSKSKKSTPGSSSKAASKRKLSTEISTESNAVPQENKKTRPTTRSQTKNTILFTILQLLLMMTTVFSQNHSIVHPDTGLYIEKLGEAHLSQGRLRLDIAIPKATFNEERNNISEIWDKTQRLCDRTIALTKDTQCKILMHHLEHEKNELLDQLEQIDEISAINGRRSKRGLLGTVMHWMLGFDDENDDTTGRNQNAILGVINQQSTLLDTKISQSNKILEQKLKLFNERADQLWKAIEETRQAATARDDTAIELKILTMYLEAINYLDELKEKYSTIIKVMTQQGYGAGIISQNQLKRKITTALHELGGNYIISMNMKHLTDFTVSQDEILIHVYYSVVEAITYELIHIISIPQHIANNTFAIQPIKTPLLGVNFHSERYFTLSQEELDKCGKIQESIYSCQPDMIFEIPKKPSCLIDQIFNKPETDPCPIEKVNVKQTIWKKLNSENSWLFLTEKITPIAVICGGFREEIAINGSGILRIRKNCFVKTNEVILTTSSIIKTKATAIFNRKIMFVEANSTEFDHKPVTKLHLPSVIQPGEDIFATASIPVPKIVAMETFHVPKHTPYTITGVTTCIVLGFIIWKTRDLWIKLIRKCLTCSSPTTSQAQSVPDEVIYHAPTSTPRTAFRRRLQEVLQPTVPSSPTD